MPPALAAMLSYWTVPEVLRNSAGMRRPLKFGVPGS